MPEAGLPPLNEFGHLPPGIHDSTLEQVGAAFAPYSSPQRRKLYQRLCEYVAELRRLGPDWEVIIDGSFVMPRVDGDLGPATLTYCLFSRNTGIALQNQDHSSTGCLGERFAGDCTLTFSPQRRDQSRTGSGWSSSSRSIRNGMSPWDCRKGP